MCFCKFCNFDIFCIFCNLNGDKRNVYVFELTCFPIFENNKNIARTSTIKLAPRVAKHARKNIFKIWSYIQKNTQNSNPIFKIIFYNTTYTKHVQIYFKKTLSVSELSKQFGKSQYLNFYFVTWISSIIHILYLLYICNFYIYCIIWIFCNLNGNKRRTYVFELTCFPILENNKHRYGSRFD